MKIEWGERKSEMKKEREIEKEEKKKEDPSYFTGMVRSRTCHDSNRNAHKSEPTTFSAHVRCLFVNRAVCLVELKWLVADVFIILYSHSRARPLGMLGAGDKKSPLTSTTALRAVELCWVHSDRPVITAGGCTGVACTVVILPITYCLLCIQARLSISFRVVKYLRKCTIIIQKTFAD